jgi:hypothetical protein
MASTSGSDHLEINFIELKKKPIDTKNDAEQLHLEIYHLNELNQTLFKRIEELEIHLKKYTNGDNHKRYYEKNKTKIKESGSLYLQKLKEENPEKIKAYSRAAYEKKKDRKKLEEAKLAENTIISRDIIL